MDKEGIKSLMKEIPLSRELDHEEMDLMANYLEYKKEPARSTIMKEGDIGNALYFLVSGKVAVSIDMPIEPQPPLVHREKGQVIGEMAILGSNNIRTATIVALSEIELLILSKDNYERLIDEDIKTAFKVLKSITINLCQRIKDQSESIAVLRLFG